VEAFALPLACLIDGLAIQAILRDPEATPDAVRSAALDMAGRELGVEPDRASKSRRPVRPATVPAEGRRGG
jgi:hypothetical protein